MFRMLAEYLPFYAIAFFLTWLYFLVGTILVHRDLHRRPSRFKGKLPLRWTVTTMAFLSGGLTITSVVILL